MSGLLSGIFFLSLSKQSSLICPGSWEFSLLILFFYCFSSKFCSNKVATALFGLKFLSLELFACFIGDGFWVKTLFQLKRSYKYFSILSSLANSFALPFAFMAPPLSNLTPPVSLIFDILTSPVSSFSFSSTFF